MRNEKTQTFAEFNILPNLSSVWDSVEIFSETQKEQISRDLFSVETFNKHDKSVFISP